MYVFSDKKENSSLYPYLKGKDIKAYIKLLQLSSAETYLHSLNTAGYTYLMAKDLGYRGRDMENIIKGALLHDVGKTAIPLNVLQKNGKLTGEEQRLVHTHPEIGHSMTAYKFSKEINDIILYHHEKLDGSGYPKGIWEIPKPVQIVTVADIYDALVSERAYKAWIPHKEAVKILMKEAEQGKLNKEFVRILAMQKSEAAWGKIKPVVSIS